MQDSGIGLRRDLSAEQFRRFRDWIHVHSGIYLEESKLDSLCTSLATRATRLGFDDYEEYYRLLAGSDEEFKELLNLITINETSFFRFSAQFDALRDFVIPEIVESKPRLSHSLRAWSAGCSTGEEPYSIAITMLDSGLGSGPHRIEVLGTDVSTRALDCAREAVYPTRSLADMPSSVVQRWFEPTKGGHRPVEKVRAVVQLAYHNLVREPYPLSLLSGWDLIFCRNVTIYFRLESTRRAVQNFYEALNPGGYLFTGHSETLSAITDLFEPVELGGVFLYRKPRLRHARSAGDVHSTRAEPMSPFAAQPTARQSAHGPGRSSGPPSDALQSSAADPGSPSIAEMIEQARALIEEGRADEGRALAGHVLELEPGNPNALAACAHAHAEAGDFVAAIDCAGAALASDPLLASARYILGIIYQRQGDTGAALAEFKRTTCIDPEFVLAHFNSANIYRASGSAEEACKSYDNTLRALHANPAGSWRVFLGGFGPDLLVQACQRSLSECRKDS